MSSNKRYGLFWKEYDVIDSSDFDDLLILINKCLIQNDYVTKLSCDVIYSYFT